ncbi:MAG: hypothetical protein R6U98_06595 [Pirellulaceae bacterium]
MSNSTRLALRTRLRRLLNDVDDEHFSDAVLNELIDESYNEWVRRFMDDNPRFGRQTMLTTYPGGYVQVILCDGYLDYDALTVDFSEGTVLTGAISGATATILMDEGFAGATGRLWLTGVDRDFQDGENITDADGGSADADGELATVCDVQSMPRISKILSVTQYMSDGSLVELYEAASMDQFLGKHSINDRASPNQWYFDHDIIAYSGVVFDKQVLMLRPIPDSDVTLAIFIQPETDGLESDTATTGLPNYVEKPVVYQAAIAARLTEENPNTKGLEKMFAMSEDAYINAVDRYVTGPEQIVYDENLVW